MIVLTITFSAFMDNFKNGHYIFSGVDTLELAQKYGTPLYVMSQDIIENQVIRLKKALDSTGIEYKIYFAGKSFLNKGMCNIIDNLGLYLDSVSGGEIYTALEAGFPPEKIAFHGNYKSDEEFKLALKNNIGLIIIDSITELEKLNKLGESLDKKIPVLIRVNPGVEAHTHELINTGMLDSKFGISVAEVEELLENFEYNNLNLKGLHCHVGSQIVEDKPFLLAAEKVLSLFKKAKDNNLNLEELNLGGGFGVAYTKDEQDFIPEDYIPKLIEKLKELTKEKDIDFPIISFEPGRFISSPAGITLYTVGPLKEIPEIRTYLSVDGGMMDNPRPALYQADYEALICNRELTEDNRKKVRLSGRACENDYLIDEIELADPKEGDILAVLNTGAYNYSMASHYNRLPKPAVVLLFKGQSDILVERENYSDLTRKDKIPDWVK